MKLLLLAALSLALMLPAALRGDDFTSSSGVTIPSAGTANPYPSTITVSGTVGPITGVQVKLNGFSHTFPLDVDIFLVSPDGKVASLMSDAGGGNPGVSNVNLVFDDAAAGPISSGSNPTSGTYRPVDHESGESLPPGATGTIGTNLNALAAAGANGDWKLFVSDDAGGDSGSITSWTLSIQDSSSGALSFAGGGKYVSVPGFHTLGVSNEVTVEFWANANALADHSAFILFPDHNANRFQAHVSYINGTTYWDFGDISSNGRLSMSNPSGTIGAWKHYALVASQSGSYMKIYVNGALQTSSATMNDFATTLSYALRIGSNFNGKLDEFRVWNVARTPVQIQESMRRTLTGNEAGLRLYFKLDETSGTTATNSATATGAAFDGNLVGGPVPAGGYFYTVTTTADSGAGSLRDTLAAAVGRAGADTIRFAPALSGQTIILNSQLSITDTAGVTVDASSLPLGLTISDGTATTYRLMQVNPNTVLTLRGLTFKDGGGTGFVNGGGAIYNNGGFTVVERCTFTGNRGGGGGAVFNENSIGRMSLTHCTFAGNTATQEGGAIFNNSSTMTITHCTVYGNSAVNLPTHSGILNYLGTITLNNSIIAGNSSGGNFHNQTSNLVVLGRNLIQTAISGGGTQTGTGTISTSAPNLLPFSTYPGSGLATMPPLTGGGSPAIDTATTAAGLASDQRGVARGTLAYNDAFEPGTGSGEGYALGSATLDSNTLRLTSGVASNQTGSFVMPDLGSLSSFTATFDYRFTTGNGPSGGLSFNFGPEPAAAVGTYGINNGHSVIFEIASFFSYGNIYYYKNGTPQLTALGPKITGADSDAGSYRPISVTLTSTGLLTVKYNGITAIDGVATGYTYTPGHRMSFGAFTAGSAYSEQRIDNISVMTQPLVVPDIGAAEAVSGPVTVTVLNANNSGPGSLRDAIAAAPAGSTITFAPELGGQTITLTSEITLNRGVTLDADSLPGGVTISGGNANRLFMVPQESGVQLKFIGLTLTQGRGEHGSAIFVNSNDTASTVTFERCTIANNTGGAAPATAGAIYTYYATLNLSHCTLAGNSATDYGGGAIYSGSAPVNLTHCTVSGNSATGTHPGGNGAKGGGIYMELPSAVLTLTNSIVSGNTAAHAASGDIYNGGAVTREGANLVRFLFNAPGTGSDSGPAALTGNPLLSALTNNGGPTRTLLPLLGSPAVDPVGGTTSSAFATDQRGFARVTDGDGNGSAIADIGAVEVRRVLVTTKVDQNDTPTGPQTSLREALRDDAESDTADYIGFDPAVFTGGAANVISLANPLGLDSALVVTHKICVDGPGITLDDGSAISYRLFEVTSTSDLTLRGLTLANGGGSELFYVGGAITNYGLLTLNQCTLSGNSTVVDAGAIYNAGALTLTQCTLSNNTAGNGSSGSKYGGGILNSGTLNLSHCTLAGNAGGYGGGIFSYTPATMTHCTLTNNTAQQGGGISTYSNQTILTHCIVAGNTGPSGADILNGGILTFSGTNIVQALLNGGGGSTVGSFTNQPPQLAPFANYGGPTQTFGLLPGSPARNGAPASTATSDQRGFPIVAAADIGAFEAQASGISLARSLNNSAFGQSVTFTATVTPAPPETTTATGTVQFVIDGSAAGSPVALNGSGAATLTTSSLSAGTHTIAATYSGDTRLLGNEVTLSNQTVNAANTTVALSSNHNPSTAGVNVTFTATVAPVAPGAGTPTGTVTFAIDGTPQTPRPLSGGQATFVTNTLTVGSRSITATYNGNPNFNSSASSPLGQSINPAVTLTGTLPLGIVGVAISQTLTAANGTGVKGMNITNFVSGGTGLSTPVTGANTATLSGTPTGPGMLTFDLTATDTVGGTVTQSYSFTVVELVVTNANLGGPGSLHFALLTAGIAPGPDTITFAPGFTGPFVFPIEMVVTSDVTIDGTAAAGGVKFETTGASRLFTIASGSTVTLRGLWLTGGTGAGAAQTGSGGAILNQGTLTVDRCTFSANAAVQNGGAITNDTGATLTLTQSTLAGNQALSGGAIFNRGTMQATHATLSGNIAGTAVTTGSGGGLSGTAGASLTLTHCIIAGNTLFSGAANDVFCVGAVQIQGASLIPVLAAAGIPPANPAILTAAPVLSPLASYGGPTPTMPPLAGSPAIDQAIVLSPALLTDQRGSARPFGLRPDLGAVEADIIIVTTAADELDDPGTTGTGLSLREAVRDVPAGGMVAFDRALFHGSTATTNTITLTKGPLNPPRNCTLNGTPNPGGIKIVTQLMITQQPLSQSVDSDDPVNFAVIVTDISNGVDYQWRKGGENIPAVTSAAYFIPSVQEGHEGVYDVVLSEAAPAGALTLTNVTLTPGSATSQPASLIVDGTPVAIQRQPESAMLALGDNHTLSVIAVGPGTLTYQWMKGATKVPGATGSSYTITKATLTHAGAYTCVVKSGALPAVTSDVAEIGVVDTTLKTVNLAVGGTFTPVVNAAGNGLTYLWSSGQTTKTFNIKPVQVVDEGLYTCAVTGLAGTLTGGHTRLNVSATPPQLVKPLVLPAATIGQSYFYQIPVVVVAGAPALTYSVTGLPPGLTCNTTTGLISGRPTASKPAGYALTLKAINPRGNDSATATLLVNVVPNTAVGVFAGPAERSPLNDNLGGRFDLTTTATGTFSGSVTLGARAKLSFTTQPLQSSGAGDTILQGTIPGLTMADKTPLTAYVEIFAVEQIARLTLVHPNGATLVIPAWRNPWNTTTAKATAYAAYYTVRLDPANTGTPPRGYGYASFTVAPAGTLTLAGKLPDGSGITGGAFVGANGEILIFNLLYANRGSHVGQFTITPGTPVVNNALNGATSWFKPAPLPTSTDTVYRAGFGPLTVTAEGGPYVPPAKGQRVMGLPLAVVPATNAKLDFTLGGLDVEGIEFNQLLRITNPSANGLTNTATIGTPVANTTKMTTLDVAKGLFSGSFTIAGATTPRNRLAPYNGQFVTIDGTTQGYGHFILPTVPVAPKTVATSPKLSGRVVLGTP